MMFGEAASESPRVPSPWTNARSKGQRSSSFSSPLYTKKSRRVPRIALTGDSVEDRFSSPTTEEEVDAFFALDQELDISKLDLSSGSQESSQGPSSTATAASSASPSPTRRLAPEPDALGNLEYKLRILPPTRHRYDRLLTQLKWRMLQGGGQCTYEIGVLDDGRCVGICPLEMRASLRVLASLAAELGAAVQVRRAFTLSPTEELHSMGSVEAQDKLADRVTAAATQACGCQTEDSLMVINLQHLGLEETENAYSLNLESEKGETHDTLKRPTTFDDKESDHDGLEDLDEGSFTFSLSYDERATMKGLKHRRESTPGRRCRYRAASAAQKRQKEATAQRLAQEVRGEGLLVPVSSSLLESSELQQQPSSDEVYEVGTSLAAGSCGRVIVEALVLRPWEEKEREFIDYSSL